MAYKQLIILLWFLGSALSSSGFNRFQFHDLATIKFWVRFRCVKPFEMIKSKRYGWWFAVFTIVYQIKYATVHKTSPTYIKPVWFFCAIFHVLSLFFMGQRTRFVLCDGRKASLLALCCLPAVGFLWSALMLGTSLRFTRRHRNIMRYPRPLFI